MWSRMICISTCSESSVNFRKRVTEIVAIKRELIDFNPAKWEANVYGSCWNSWFCQIFNRLSAEVPFDSISIPAQFSLDIIFNIVE